MVSGMHIFFSSLNLTLTIISHRRHRLACLVKPSQVVKGKAVKEKDKDLKLGPVFNRNFQA